MRVPKLKALRTLLSYLLASLFLFTPFGWPLLFQLPFIGKSKYCLDTWYLIDKLICHFCHGTGRWRTISGWTGQHMKNHKRYYVQAKLIDLLLGKDHCYNAFLAEKERGYVKADG